MRHRRAVIAIAALGLVALSAHRPTADFRFVTHDVRDPAPVKVQAALDLGLMGVSILYTWSRQIR